jgi:hypothetical protein
MWKWEGVKLKNEKWHYLFVYWYNRNAYTKMFLRMKFTLFSVHWKYSDVVQLHHTSTNQTSDNVLMCWCANLKMARCENEKVWKWKMRNGIICLFVDITGMHTRKYFSEWNSHYFSVHWKIMWRSSTTSYINKSNIRHPFLWLKIISKSHFVISGKTKFFHSSISWD